MLIKITTATVTVCGRLENLRPLSSIKALNQQNTDKNMTVRTLDTRVHSTGTAHTEKKTQQGQVKTCGETVILCTSSEIKKW